jgi:cysteine-rich repeat protein
MCGNGILDQGEECDDGNDDNTDGCIITKNIFTVPYCAGGTNNLCPNGDSDCPGSFCVRATFNIADPALSCKRASCGDGFSQKGVEACDTGILNLDVNNKAAVDAWRGVCTYGKTCNFCTTTCTLGAVNGGYCGDTNVQPSYEICDPTGRDWGTWSNSRTTTNEPPSQASETFTQICQASCQTTCPPTFFTSPSLTFTSSSSSPNYVDRITNLRSGQT